MHALEALTFYSTFAIVLGLPFIVWAVWRAFGKH